MRGSAGKRFAREERSGLTGKHFAGEDLIACIYKIKIQNVT